MGYSFYQISDWASLNYSNGSKLENEFIIWKFGDVLKIVSLQKFIYSHNLGVVQYLCYYPYVDI